MKKRIVVAAGPVAMATGLLLGACSSSDDHGGMSMEGSGMGTETSIAVDIPLSAPFNAADVAFAQGMIPHHAQAIEMAEMALAKSSNAQVTELAQAIRDAQQPEIDQLTTWLEEWDQPVPDVGMGHSMSGMDDMPMSGMMSEEDMQRLDDSMGPDFDREFLEMMIVHHRGAVDMAEDELADGKFPDAKAMAQTIVDTQQAEITQMETMLAEM